LSETLEVSGPVASSCEGAGVRKAHAWVLVGGIAQLAGRMQAALNCLHGAE